ncbi:MAG: endonuclease III [Candidatus Micrarchaeota archaeon]|nr:endonuclease III [Candidatus Micrarchaeota archaeon]
MSKADEKRRFLATVVRRLKRRYRDQMVTTLDHTSPFDLLVATILSAQAQDATVNRYTPKLFRDYSSVDDFAEAKPSEIYPYIKNIGLYRSKGKNIVMAARVLRERFSSRVPRTIGELTQLPGVGRKTANVVLSNAYGIHEGIAIDTHCITVTNRLGLVRARDPAKIEQRLMGMLPSSEWKDVSHLFIALGRDVCTAKAKHCERCVLRDICPSSTAR